jgi:hypothetical protein
MLTLLLMPLAGVLAFASRRFRRAPERVRPPLNVRLGRGWREAKRSWTVLRDNRSLLVLPFASFLLGTGGWMGGWLLAGTWVERTMPRFALTGFIVLLPLTIAGTFLGVAFIAALSRRLDGEHAGVADGLRLAWARRGPVLRWSLLAAGVGAILQGLQQLKSEWALAPLLSWLAGIAWGVLTVFVLPVLALEGVGVRAAVRRAGSLVGDRWGESVAGLGNLSLVGAVLGAPLGVAIGIGIAIAAPDRDTVMAVSVAGFVAFRLMVSAIGAAGQVLSLALYRYATGRSTGPFRADELDDALIPRRRPRLR